MRYEVSLAWPDRIPPFAGEEKNRFSSYKWTNSVWPRQTSLYCRDCLRVEHFFVYVKFWYPQKQSQENWGWSVYEAVVVAVDAVTLYILL